MRTPTTLTALATALLAAAVLAQGFAFVKLADTGTPIPGTDETFYVLGTPSIDETGTIAFCGQGYFGRPGLYTTAGGQLGVVADAATPIPGRETTFAHGFRSYGASIRRGAVAFYAYTQSTEASCGVYLWKDGVLSVVADADTPIPGEDTTFNAGEDGFGFGPFSHPPTDGETVAFRGAGTDTPRRQRGIYVRHDGILSVVADLYTPIPDGVGEFSFMSAAIALTDGKVAFQAQGFDLQRGIYTNRSGALAKVVDKRDAIPGGTGTFTSVDYPWFDGERIVFAGDGPDGQQGIYVADGGKLAVVADKNTPIPGREGTFTDFAFNWSPPAANAGNVAFRALGADGHEGVYLARGSAICKVIDTTDTLGGKDVRSLALGPAAVAGKALALRVGFADDTAAIYVAAPAFMRGDASGDGACDIGDAVYVLGYLFARGGEPPCHDAADANDDARIDLSDTITLLLHLFRMQGSLPAPAGACGADPTTDVLPCEAPEPCR